MIYGILSTKPHNPHYLKRYIKFIDSCIAHNTNNNITQNIEKHHICPKAKDLFPEYKSLHKFKWNCAFLTIGQHYVAHRILASVYQTRSMICAFILMNKKGQRNRSVYIALRNRLSKLMRDNNPMHDPIVAEKSRMGAIGYWTIERRAEFAHTRIGVNNITEEGYISLSRRWVGTKRPKTENHIENHKNSQQICWFVTPSGKYRSPNEASRSENISNVSIKKRCVLFVDSIITSARGSKTPKEWVGKTWREVGYYTIPLS